MSQDSTMVPGMEGSSKGFPNNMYQRGGATNTGNSNGTVVPGMSSGVNRNFVEAVNVSSNQEPQNKVASGAPVVGFLYSISNNGIPEYWPIQLGNNTIGRSADNDVVLNERTVSGVHASIMVQKKRTNGEVIAVVRLERGRTGVLVNNEEVDLRYGSECKNGDVITVGENYKFVLILIYAESYGLTKAENFIPAEIESEEDDEIITKLNTNKRTSPGRPDGTMAMDGSNNRSMPGGTKFM